MPLQEPAGDRMELPYVDQGETGERAVYAVI